jgi:aminoglycoside phosphotransferase (APT) family kinase protein
MRMHPDAVAVSDDLARTLLARQFPKWVGLPIQRVGSTGTDHAIFRLGEEFAIRAPVRRSAAAQVDKEQAWLPRLEGRLPFPVPTPLAAGEPADGYPFRWSICRWLEGVNPGAEVGSSARFGADLGIFVSALRDIDPTGGPAPGKHNFGRGAPLSFRDVSTRAAISEVAKVDTGIADRALAAWGAGLVEADQNWRPVWIHGDLCPGNLLSTGHRLCGVLDFGGLAVGDPACDLIVAWNFLTDDGREAFKQAVAVDNPIWRRGRMWALSIALVQLPYYLHTNPSLASLARVCLERVFADHEHG